MGKVVNGGKSQVLFVLPSSPLAHTDGLLIHKILACGLLQQATLFILLRDSDYLTDHENIQKTSRKSLTKALDGCYCYPVFCHSYHPFGVKHSQSIMRESN